MTGKPIRLLFVDDNERLISAWQRLISMQPDMELVGALRCADELTTVARDKAANVVLIDLSMNGRDPLDAVSELSRECPDIRTVVYSGHSRSEWLEKSRRAGASQYVDKADDPQDVLDVIRKVRGIA